jgi:hypothetical protein
MERGSDRFDLAAELNALRPGPEARFAADLDARVAAGFPRERWPAWLAGLGAQLQGTPRRRLLVPAGAFTAIAVAVATGVIAIATGGGSSGYEPRVATSIAPGPIHRPHGKTQFSEAPPVAAGGASHAESAAGRSSDRVVPSSPETLSGQLTGPYASRARERDVERGAAVVLAADPADVRGDAAKVFEVVHAANGIVMRSSIQDGSAGEAGASFDLLIPSGRLGDALASLPAIADVRSQHESTQDITAPTVGVAERLEDARATISGLLAQLAIATSGAERAPIESRLHRERARAAALRSRLSDLRRRVSFSRVSIRIETRDEGSSGGSGWGFDDGLRTAGQVLAVAAGAIVVGLAGLAPLALVILLATLAYRAWLRRARDTALS